MPVTLHAIPSDAIVFYTDLQIDQLCRLWQPQCYTPIRGLIVVSLLMKAYDVSKVQAHASALLDLHLRLSEKNALLQKLVFDKSVVAHLGGKRSHHGVATLQHTLCLSCAQDIAKIVFDRGRRTPSVANIMSTLKDGKTKKQLEHNFSVWEEPDYREYSDPAIVEALRRIDLRQSEHRRDQFSQLLKELKTLTNALLACPTFKAFKTVRDKFTAHTEIKLVADKYAPIDLGALSLKWGDVNTCVGRLERPVELIGLVVRNSSFAWDGFHKQLETNVASVWENAKGAS